MRHLVGVGEGGELAKEVAFAFMFLLIFLASLFFDVQWLSSFPFYEAVILYSLFFQKLDPFCIQFFFFCVLLNLWFEKLKLCPILLTLDWFHA